MQTYHNFPFSPLITHKQPDPQDGQILERLRTSLDNLVGALQRGLHPSAVIWEFAPIGQFDWTGFKNYHSAGLEGYEYVVDLCDPDSVSNLFKKKDTYPGDVVLCFEILEHTLDPFQAAEQLAKLTAPSGILLVSTPLNFRIHGPSPDLWRFTPHGLQVLFSKYFHSVEIQTTDSGRVLFPGHCITICRNKK